MVNTNVDDGPVSTVSGKEGHARDYRRRAKGAGTGDRPCPREPL